MLLAVLLEQPDLRFRRTYRTLFILPYAVPGVLSILILKGLFNQEFGAVNELLRGIFGFAPEWETNPWGARSMILLVNLWLGYPYMMLICTGMLQSIPSTIYEASAIDGSNPKIDFFQLTLPLVLPAMIPILISSFAFNFNNFNLIFLLTGGGPQMVGGNAGETDLLVTYTFNIAFKDSGTNFRSGQRDRHPAFHPCRVPGLDKSQVNRTPGETMKRLTPEQRTSLRKIISHTLLIGLLVLVLVPYIMVVSASFRRGNFAPSSLLPDHVSLEHWKYVLGIPYEEVINPGTGETRMVKAETPPLLWFWNSIKVSSIASIGILLLSGTAAYAFARLHFKFRTTTLSALLILQMFPMVLALVAIYVILDFIGQYVPGLGLNTQTGLIMVYLGGISGYIWMLKGYFDTIPASMEESARIDGATQFQTFTQILLPMSLPIFAVVFILSFIAFMSEYPVASIVLQARENWTLAVGANSFLAEHQKLWGRFAALAVLSGVPITVMFLVCQKYVVGGLTSGGVKE